MSGQAGNGNQGFSARETTPGLDTRHAHSARVYNYWLGGEDNFAADREAAEQAIAACDYVDADLRDTSAILRAASATLDLSQPVALMLLIILHQQWRPEPGVLSPPQVTAWCGVARKP
jgi:hypothetical protein